MSTRASNSNSVPMISQVKMSKRRTEVNMFVQDAQKGWSLCPCGALIQSMDATL